MTTRPPFSRRTAWELEPNALSTSTTAARRDGEDLVDLTESNPTRVGLGVSVEHVALLGDPRGVTYDPSPFGLAGARDAVARYYAERGEALRASRVVLSASTSESYGWIFKLLCDPGDRVLVPSPSYPLLSFLADLEGVELAPHALVESRGWAIDVDAIGAGIDERTRAVVLVHPNNPTGSFVRRDDADALDRLCAERGIAIVADEVFGDYAHAPLAAAALPTFVREARALTFTLSGLSKVVAMPQAKLGWIVAGGRDDIVEQALARLEVIADTYLSVSSAVQLAAPGLLGARGDVQRRILERVTTNLAALDAALAGGPARRLPVEAGWYAIVDAPSALDDEAWAKLMLAEARVLVQPGYFFDLDGSRLVVSLLPPEGPFARAANAMAATLRRPRRPSGG